MNREGLVMENETFILSMTSYPPRFSSLLDFLKNLNEQTVYPEKLILNVAFEDMKFLPVDLKSLQLAFPLEINATEDIGPAKKLIPTLIRYSSSTIVTIDDDIRYPPNLFRMLLDESAVNPNSIICSRAHEPSFLDGFPSPYIAWKFEVEEMGKRLYCPTSGAGVLFPPLSLHKEVCDIDKYRSLSFSTDDLWYWVHAIKNRTRIKKTKESFKIQEFSNDLSIPLHSANILVLNNYNLEKLWLNYNMSQELQDYCQKLDLKSATYTDLSEYQRMLLDFRLSFLDTDLFDLLDSLPLELRVKVAREVSVGYKRVLELMISSRELPFSSKLVAGNLFRKLRKLFSSSDHS